jgi:hypothetical protein
MTWRLSTHEKKSVTEVQTWTNGELTAQLELGWRWGHWEYDVKPDISKHDSESQTDVFEFGDVQDQEQDDCCWQEWTWPEGMDEDEMERLTDIFNEDGTEGLENEGWENTDTEYFVTGPLDVEFVPENYQKKPVVVQAVRFTADNIEGLREFCGDSLGEVTETEAHIRTLEDGSEHQVEHIATLGDYIIKGIKGEFYPCKPDIFEASYETTWREYEQVN